MEDTVRITRKKST